MAVVRVPPIPITTPLADDKTQSGISWPWLRWYQQVQAKLGEITTLQNGTLVLKGPFANDAAAKSAGINVGQPYYLPTGAVAVRLT